MDWFPNWDIYAFIYKYQKIKDSEFHLLFETDLKKNSTQNTKLKMGKIIGKALHLFWEPVRKNWSAIKNNTTYAAHLNVIFL